MVINVYAFRRPISFLYLANLGFFVIFLPRFILFRYDEHAAAIGRPVNFPLPGQGQALKVRLGAAIKRSFKRFSAEKERSPGKKSSTDIVTLNAPELVRTSTSSSTSSANNPVVSQLLPPAAVTCEHVDNENIIDKPSFST